MLKGGVINERKINSINARNLKNDCSINTGEISKNRHYNKRCTERIKKNSNIKKKN